MATRNNATTDRNALNDYVEGVWALKREPANDTRYSRYDWYVLWHVAAMMTYTPPGTSTGRNAAHSGPAFLPWHRNFLNRLELDIRRVLGKPDFGLPYWTWNVDATLPPIEQPNTPIWGDDALGGSGNPIQTGPFRYDPNNPTDPNNWAVRIEMVSTTEVRLTRRALERRIASNGAVPDLSIRGLFDALNFGSYDRPPWTGRSVGSLRNLVEGWVGPERPALHNRVHVWIGGDMSRGHSPNDPVFFLHHCNIDRIWSYWQTVNGFERYAPPTTASPDLTYHRLDDRVFQMSTDDVEAPQIVDLLDHRSDYNYASYDDLEAFAEGSGIA